MPTAKEKLPQIQIDVNSSWANWKQHPFAEKKRNGLKCTEMQEAY